MKRMICAILVVVLIVGMFPVTAFAAGNTYIEVTKDNAAVRTKADGDAKIALRLEEGVVLESVGTHYNWKKLSNWYEIRIPGKEGTYFIFAGNVGTHEHETTDITVNDIVYKLCSGCGDISAEATTADPLYMSFAAISLLTVASTSRTDMSRSETLFANRIIWSSSSRPRIALAWPFVILPSLRSCLYPSRTLPFSNC